MSVRTFIFCDGCNHQGIRNISNDELYARRASDGRAWYEGALDSALKVGWVVSKQGYILCPTCIEKGLYEMFIDYQIDGAEMNLNTTNTLDINIRN